MLKHEYARLEHDSRIDDAALKLARFVSDDPDLRNMTAGEINAAMNLARDALCKFVGKMPLKMSLVAATLGVDGEADRAAIVENGLMDCIPGWKMHHDAAAIMDRQMTRAKPGNRERNADKNDRRAAPALPVREPGPTDGRR